MSDPTRDELIQDFPELSDPYAVLEKEIYAHFGRLFFSFSLVEDILITAVTIHGAFADVKSGKVGSKSTWSETFDRHFELAKTHTFGTLSRLIEKVPEFSGLSRALESTKRKRDYFAHHFFRDEVSYFGSPDGCWLLLLKIEAVVRESKALEAQLSERADKLYQRIGFVKPTQEYVLETIEREYNEAHRRVIAGSPKMGWE